MGSNSKKGQTYWNLAVDPAMGGIQGYQAGSTFKAFTAAAALEKGIPLSQEVQREADDELRRQGLRDLRRARAGLREVAGQQLHRHQRQHEHVQRRRHVGEHLLRPARARHRHVPGHQDGQEARREASAPPTATSSTTTSDKPSFTLGSVEVSPLSMAEAYATFAARGIHCSPIIVSKIGTTRTKQEARGAGRANCKRVIEQGRRRRHEQAAGRGDEERHRHPGPDLRRPPAGRQDRAPSTATRRSGSPATPRMSPASR